MGNQRKRGNYSMKSGDKFRKVYPFKHISYGEDDFWVGGCHSQTDDGAEIMDGYFEQCTNYFCDAEGFIDYEVLAVVEMPRKYQTRIIYRVTLINPDGKEKRSSSAHTVTEAKFLKWISSPYSSYPHDYEVG